MAAVSGRSFLVRKAGTAIAGIKVSSVSFDGSPVDITKISDAGFQAMAGFSGKESLTIECSGVWDASTVPDIALEPNGALLLTDITIIDAKGATIAGNFFIASYREEGADDNAVQFSATFQSSGAWTRTGP